MTLPEGLLLVDKPAGMTSHDVVDAVRRELGTRKVGHAGTLDPMATGLLLVGVGRATRLLRFLSGLDKSRRTPWTPRGRWCGRPRWPWTGGPWRRPCVGWWAGPSSGRPRTPP